MLTYICKHYFLIILVPVSTAGETKKEVDSEGEKGEEKEEERGDGREQGRRMSYQADHVLEDETLQYRVQGTFSHHRFRTLSIFMLATGETFIIRPALIFGDRVSGLNQCWVYKSEIQ